MPITTPTNIDYLIMYVRLRVGDTNATLYRYTDDWLRTSLVGSVRTLGGWWNFKYLLDVDNNVYRNPHGYFIFDEPTYGIIEPSDEQIMVLMACYILLEGSLENSAWDFVSWTDAEIRYSNLEQSRTRNENLSRLWNELLTILKPPQKRLAWPRKGSLPGYLNNPYEVARKDN